MTAIFTALGRHDERVLHALVLKRSTLVDRGMRAVTHLGDTWVVIGIAIALCLAAVPELQRAGQHAALILTTSHLLVQMLKRTVSRPRPHLPPGCALLIEVPDRFSFPSGHSAASLSIALPLLFALPAALGGIVLALALCVGISRCYLGVHYPGDVIAGWAAAVAMALAVGAAVGG